MGNVNIDFLVDDLKPVRFVKSSSAFILTAITTMAIAVLVAVTIGTRPDIAAANPAAIVLARSGILLLLGCVTLRELTISARPEIGSQSNGWKWIVVLAGVIPLITFTSWLRTQPTNFSIEISSSSMRCLGISISAAFAIATPLTLWLRRGATVTINRSAWLVGLTAGSLGAFCYNLNCPSQTIGYACIWYLLSVVLSTIAGRLMVPHFIRW